MVDVDSRTAPGDEADGESAERFQSPIKRIMSALRSEKSRLLGEAREHTSGTDPHEAILVRRRVVERQISDLMPAVQREELKAEIVLPIPLNNIQSVVGDRRERKDWRPIDGQRAINQSHYRDLPRDRRLLQDGEEANPADAKELIVEKYGDEVDEALAREREKDCLAVSVADIETLKTFEATYESAKEKLAEYQRQRATVIGKLQGKIGGLTTAPDVAPAAGDVPGDAESYLKSLFEKANVFEPDPNHPGVDDEVLGFFKEKNFSAVCAKYAPAKYERPPGALQSTSLANPSATLHVVERALHILVEIEGWLDKNEPFPFLPDKISILRIATAGDTAEEPYPFVRLSDRTLFMMTRADQNGPAWMREVAYKNEQLNKNARQVKRVIGAKVEYEWQSADLADFRHEHENVAEMVDNLGRVEECRTNQVHILERKVMVEKKRDRHQLHLVPEDGRERGLPELERELGALQAKRYGLEQRRPVLALWRVGRHDRAIANLDRRIEEFEARIVEAKALAAAMLRLESSLERDILSVLSSKKLGDQYVGRFNMRVSGLLRHLEADLKDLLAQTEGLPKGTEGPIALEYKSRNAALKSARAEYERAKAA